MTIGWALPSDPGKAVGSWGAARRAEPEKKDRRKRQKPLGSLFPDPRESPCLLASLSSKRAASVDSGIFPRQAPPYWTGILSLPHPPRTEPPGAGGSDKEKRGFCPRGAVFSRSPLTLREMCSEPGVPALDPSLYYLFPPRLAGPVSLNFDSLAPEPWLIAGLVGCLGLAHPPHLHRLRPSYHQSSHSRD